MELMHSRLCILYFWIVHSISYCFPYEADPARQYMAFWERFISLSTETRDMVYN